MQHCMKLLHVWPKIYMFPFFFSIHVSTEYMQTIRLDSFRINCTVSLRKVVYVKPGESFIVLAGISQLETTPRFTGKFIIIRFVF